VQANNDNVVIRNNAIFFIIVDLEIECSPFQ
jgi:hypothetical protein